MLIYLSLREYKVQLVHELEPDDYSKHYRLANSALSKLQEDPDLD